MDKVLVERQEMQPSLIGTWTRTSLELPENLDFGEWCNIMRKMSIMEGAIHWWIGDALVFAGKKYGETYDEAEVLTGFAHETLKKDKYVASKVEKCTRVHFLSWKHHQLVAPKMASEQEYWLGLAEENNWSVNELKKEMKDEHTMEVMGSSESPEWYTPQQVINAVLLLFDVIDLDPCSNSHETPIIPAETHYTKDDNGLSKSWFGKVYMNPPYGTEIGDWTRQLVKEYKRKAVKEAIALLPGRIDTRWFQPLYDYLICCVKGRLNFIGSPTGAPFPSVIVYLGENREKFISVFRELGPIVERIA